MNKSDPSEITLNLNRVKTRLPSPQSFSICPPVWLLRCLYFLQITRLHQPRCATNCATNCARARRGVVVLSTRQHHESHAFGHVFAPARIARLNLRRLGSGGTKPTGRHQEVIFGDVGTPIGRSRGGCLSKDQWHGCRGVKTSVLRGKSEQVGRYNRTKCVNVCELEKLAYFAYFGMLRV